MIGGCPAIEKLEALVAGSHARLERHVSKCAACQGILALLIGQGGDGLESEECAKAEILLAKRASSPLEPADAKWLESHGRECPGCAGMLGDLAS